MYKLKMNPYELETPQAGLCRDPQRLPELIWREQVTSWGDNRPWHIVRDRQRLPFSSKNELPSQVLVVAWRLLDTALLTPMNKLE